MLPIRSYGIRVCLFIYFSPCDDYAMHSPLRGAMPTIIILRGDTWWDIGVNRGGIDARDFYPFDPSLLIAGKT